MSVAVRPLSAPRIRVVPIVLKKAYPFVRDWHRHLSAPQGALFAVAAERVGEIVGVAIVGRPNARNAQTGWRVEVVRVATNGAYNACSVLYGACCRAAQALGYCEIVTKTLESEPGSSLRAANFTEDGMTDGGEWDRPSRARKPAEEPGRKRRWFRRLCNGCERCAAPVGLPPIGTDKETK
jgi:hypothetical protein